MCVYIVSSINKHTASMKKIKQLKIPGINHFLLFQAGQCTTKTDIIWYYLLPDSTGIKLCKHK